MPNNEHDSHGNGLSLAGAGALAAAGALAGALAGAGALSASVGLNGNENENSNGSYNESGNENANVNCNVNETATSVSTHVSVDLGIGGQIDLGPPSIMDSCNTSVADSIFIPEPGSGDYVLANNGGIASLYNGDVFNFGSGEGTQSVFSLDQTNALVDTDVAHSIEVSASGGHFDLSANCMHAGDVHVGDGISSADNISHATTSITAAANAAADFSAFNQSINLGSNIQYNTATQTVVGGDQISHGDTFGNLDS